MITSTPILRSFSLPRENDHEHSDFALILYDYLPTEETEDPSLDVSFLISNDPISTQRLHRNLALHPEK